jgi:hypothetical protein
MWASMSISVYISYDMILTYAERFDIPVSVHVLLWQIEQKKMYAIWKAADIRKAIKEGRKPEAGPPGGDKDELSYSTTTISKVTILSH